MTAEVGAMFLEVVESMRFLVVRLVCGVGYVGQFGVLMLSGNEKDEGSVGSGDPIRGRVCWRRRSVGSNVALAMVCCPSGTPGSANIPQEVES